ncbi:MAG: hypothetical protein WB014_13480 [Methanosarcina sp.]
MAEERETYKGREIVIKTEERFLATRAGEGLDEKKPELYIDGKHITTVREPSGIYRAARLVYAPQSSIKDLAKIIIDYEEELASNER